ncbi:hypothetical protein DNTS_013004 [Danionella cerebrum]|uniref:Uncharacterized protein n=1 Tax=Danionella cerebrum TaxID=2873325 RepID=A0A553QDL4_9TELE|nr:hypothetical protein DNTS_013004 [Danionella translucida]
MHAVSPEENEENKPVRKSLRGNWVEERATASLDKARPRSCVNKHGHAGILSVETPAKVQGTSTFCASYTVPLSPRVRLKGRRTELLENDLVKEIRAQILSELNPDPDITDLCSVTKADYKLEGFESQRTPLTLDCDYVSEQAITFWSDNYQKVQGVTAVKSMNSPFKRNATFSTPIADQLDPLDEPMQSLSEN